MSQIKSKKAEIILCVGNFDSSTGYAWKLIEHLWVVLNDTFQDKGCEVTVCYPTVSAINPELIANGIPVIQHDFRMSGLKGIIASVKFVLRHKIRHLYLTDRPAISIGYAVFRAVGVRTVIVHDHTPGYRPPVRGLKKYLKGLINALPLIGADTVIGVSPYVCTRLAEVTCIPRKRIRLVTNGISDTPHLKKHILGQPDVVRFVTVARANRYKGIDFAIATVAHLIHKRKCANIIYDLVGDGPSLDAFKRLACSLNVEGNVRFLGNQDRVDKLLPDYDFAFHPSRGEAMCLAIVEYMRCGLATVCSTNRSVNSILQPNEDAFIYRENDVEDAARVLSNLIHDYHARNRLGQNARSRFIEHYQQAAMECNFRQVLLDASVV